MYVCALLQVVCKNQTRLPPEAWRFCEQSEVDLRLGLFAEIHRAYVIADNVFYMWDYEHQEMEGIVHREEGQAIRTVGLVVPKPHVFPRSVKVSVPTTSHLLLCVNTHLDLLTCSICLWSQRQYQFAF